MNKNKYLCIDSARRRLLVASAALPALAWTSALRAQAKPPVLIGWLDPGSRESDVHLLMAFKEGLASHGWKEGTHYVIEERWLSGRMDQLPKLAQQLAARKPSVIVAQPSSLAAAAAKAAPNTPIVQMAGRPLESGNVASLAQPGGMITGLSSMAQDLIEKVVELLHEAVPKARRVGFLIDPTAMNLSATLDSARRAIKQYSIDARFGAVTTPDELEPVISRLAKEGMHALIILPNVWYFGERHRIVKYALTHRLPLAAGSGAYAEVGALLGYGADSLALRRRAAYYVDRILKGAKPADLPIEQPTKFELVVNMKTAKMLGITIPQTILVRADRVIE